MAEAARETPAEMAEIVKAAGVTGLRHAAPVCNHGARGQQASFTKITVRGNADELRKQSREVKNAHAD